MQSPQMEKISWEAHEHAHHQKNADWFWTVGIIAIGSIVLALFFRNFLFAIILALFTATSFIMATRDPRVLVFELTRKGVRAGKILYPFSTLESFWVDDGEFDDKIIFKSKKALSSYLIIPFDSYQVDPELLRDFLLDYIDEEELEEPLHQILLEWLGF